MGFKIAKSPVTNIERRQASLEDVACFYCRLCQYLRNSSGDYTANISIDHTKFLGSNISDIAKEKAGIIKENTPVVIGETQKETKPVFIDFANTKNSKIVFADEFYYESYNLYYQSAKSLANSEKISDQHFA